MYTVQIGISLRNVHRSLIDNLSFSCENFAKVRQIAMVFLLLNQFTLHRQTLSGPKYTPDYHTGQALSVQSKKEYKGYLYFL